MHAPDELFDVATPAQHGRWQVGGASTDSLPHHRSVRERAEHDVHRRARDLRGADS